MPVDHKAKRRASYEKGLGAEDAAAAYLRKKGYVVLEQRYKTSFGEIDLIVKDADTIIAVEVKTRKDLQTALESVRPQAQRRIQNALMAWVSNHPEAYNAALRFDVIAITPPLCIHHLDNAWQAQV